MPFPRYLAARLKKLGRAHPGLLLLGPRQTGKSTLIGRYLEPSASSTLVFRLQETRTLEEIAKRPSIIFDATQAALEQGPVNLFIDEVQLVPELLNDCQSLIDRNRGRLRLYLTGSSARKLRRAGTNLLPGRVILKQLHPLILPEFLAPTPQHIVPIKMETPPAKFSYPLEDILVYGTLPGMVQLAKPARSEMLRSYVSTYLQEEIRAEALARRLGPFARFLELAALESGSAPNLTKLSQETGIPLSTLINYFQILEDTLIMIRIPPFGKASRKRLLTTPRYLFFDVGIRNACAALPLNPQLLKTQAGTLFEQWVILEIIRRIDYAYAGVWKYSFWKTSYGAEVDLVIDTGKELIPIEIKYSEVPRDQDIRHLRTFMKEYGAKRGFLVGRFARPMKMAPGVLAIPWQQI